MIRAGMAIGALARRTGANIETIRYYERIGVLPPAERAGRYRRYGPEDAARLAFIRRARALGFTLEEVRALLRLAASVGATSCAEVRGLAAGHLADVRAKLADLRAIERTLADTVRRCDAGELAGCPLIDDLSAARADHAGT